MIDAIHYVIDLETLGKGPKAAIAAIGAVRIQHGQPAGEFYCRVDLESSLACGLEMDASTVQWWLKQSAEARAEMDGSQSGWVLAGALLELRYFIRTDADDNDHGMEPLVWGNGSSFDNVILASAYAACGIERPWTYRNDRDLRTLLHLYPAAKSAGPFDGTKHHALHDARHEAAQLVWALQMHQGSKGEIAIRPAQDAQKPGHGSCGCEELCAQRGLGSDEVDETCHAVYGKPAALPGQGAAK